MVRTISWSTACGRSYLYASGYILAVEGDPVRDPELIEINRKFIEMNYPNESRWFQGEASKIWTTELIKYVAGIPND